VAEQEGQQTETEATGAPQKHHYTLNQQVGSITKVAYLSYGRLLANGTIASIIASQNLITMRTSGAGLTLLESQLQRLPDIEQTVIFGNQLYITSRDEAKLKSALFAFTQQGYEFCKVDTNLEDAFTYLMKNNCEKN
ncbi:hypothetical protein ACP8W2_19710, partial [Klebsiella pneumoniae]